MSSGVNVLTNSRKILHIIKRKFFPLHFPSQWSTKCFRGDFNSVWDRLQCCLSKGLLKQDFLDMYLTTFSAVCNSEVHKQWGSYFFSKFWELNLYFKKGKNESQKVFRFIVNYISIGCIKMSLLRREYLSSAVNVLTNISKILHITKR